MLFFIMADALRHEPSPKGRALSAWQIARNELQAAAGDAQRADRRGRLTEAQVLRVMELRDIAEQRRREHDECTDDTRRQLDTLESEIAAAATDLEIASDAIAARGESVTRRKAHDRAQARLQRLLAQRPEPTEATDESGTETAEEPPPASDVGNLRAALADALRGA